MIASAARYVNRKVAKPPICCLALLLSLAATPPLDAQLNTLSDSWRWVRFTTSYGLPSNSLIDVVETTGRVWASTSRGVA